MALSRHVLNGRTVWIPSGWTVVIVDGVRFERFGMHFYEVKK